MTSAHAGPLRLCGPLLLGLLAAVAGCGKNSSGPPARPNAEKGGNTLVGSITCNGEPVKAGTVIFWRGGPVGHGTIRNGKYLIGGLPDGKGILTISASTAPPQGPHAKMLQPGAGGPPGKVGPP